MLVAPVVWVALEYGRLFVLSGFPFYSLAHSQYRYLPLIQVSDLAGGWLLSFAMALVNAWWVDVFTLPFLRPTAAGPRPAAPQIRRAAVVAISMVAIVGYGVIRLNSAHFRPGPRVALLQTDFPQELKQHATEEQVLATIDELVARAIRQGETPDLIVWPESSFPRGIPRIAPDLSESAFVPQSHELDPESTPANWRARREDCDAGLRRIREAEPQLPCSSAR